MYEEFETKSHEECFRAYGYGLESSKRREDERLSEEGRMS